jgi:hypothetical protein
MISTAAAVIIAAADRQGRQTAVKRRDVPALASLQRPSTRNSIAPTFVRTQPTVTRCTPKRPCSIVVQIGTIAATRVPNTLCRAAVGHVPPALALVAGSIVGDHLAAYLVTKNRP